MKRSPKLIKAIGPEIMLMVHKFRLFRESKKKTVVMPEIRLLMHKIQITLSVKLKKIVLAQKLMTNTLKVPEIMMMVQKIRDIQEPYYTGKRIFVQIIRECNLYGSTEYLMKSKVIKSGKPKVCHIGITEKFV